MSILWQGVQKSTSLSHAYFTWTGGHHSLKWFSVSPRTQWTVALTFAQIQKLLSRNLQSFILALTTVEVALQSLLGAPLFNWRDCITRRQGRGKPGQYPLLREVHSSLKPYPLEFNRRFLAHNLTDIQLKLKAPTVVRKLLAYYERNVSGLSSAFFWNRNRICASSIKFYFLLNELMSNVIETCFKRL